MKYSKMRAQINVARETIKRIKELSFERLYKSIQYHNTLADEFNKIGANLHSAELLKNENGENVVRGHWVWNGGGSMRDFPAAWVSETHWEHGVRTYIETTLSEKALLREQRIEMAREHELIELARLKAIHEPKETK